ncbi:MAG: CPBP family intramembrane metalloprotease, partial [Holophaga sp.]|nr:CPBP family intramembrane metalloprotease [Holophaga sp.]
LGLHRLVRHLILPFVSQLQENQAIQTVQPLFANSNCGIRVDGIGEWPTQIVLALLFGIAHWGNPGMLGAVKYWATLDIALAAVFLGLAYLRTRSLALPIGIHLGWNWTQGNVLGFGVSGTTGHPGWIRPIFHGKPEWMSGGTFGIEASIFGVIAVLIGIYLLWQWKGSYEALPLADQ